MTAREPETPTPDPVTTETTPVISDPDPPGETVGPGVTGTGAPRGEGNSEGGIGGGGADPETQLTILTAEKMEWFFDNSSGKWYVSYGLPESDRRLLFEATPDQMNALFGDNQRPLNFSRRRFEALLRQNRTTFGGNVAEMEGEGRFEDEVRRIKALALDNGVLPKWAEETGEVMDIIFIAQSEGKSQDWVLEQMARTDSFKQRFPNIKAFINSSNLTLDQAITGFLEFEAGLRSAVNATGRSTSKVTPEVVGGLLKKGYNIDTVVGAVTRFDRMKKFAPALDAFNSILEAQGEEPIKNIQEYFDFISGNSPAQFYDIWEASSIAEAAASAGLGDVFSAEDAMAVAVASEGQTSLADATQGLQQGASLLLRLRHEVDVGAFDLDTDDIIDMSLGVPLRSGNSVADIQNNITRAVSSAQASLGARSTPFTSFTSDGRPQRASLSGLRSTQ